ncbi:polysaccharide pyruvyl transferase family protein [Oscillospiraceae bacterium CM]|nr:polysaccharide pyruvyl transferase family protein [Oscillospiraceae bacterium CM]
MKKAVVVTFHCVPNYGAMLQAYAMQQNLEKFVDTAEILNYVPPHLLRQYHYFYFKTMRWFLSCLLNFPFTFVRNKKFGSFLKKYLCLTPGVYRVREALTLDCDYVFLGSDQIWSFGITDGVDKTYFGDFKKKKGCRVIAYAASYGKDILEARELALYSALLKNVDVVAVRERSAQKAIGFVYPRPVSVVLDPTLLLTREEWRCVAKKSRLKKYLLLYALNGYDETYRLAAEIAARKGLTVYEIASGGLSFRARRRHRVIPCAGPSDFLGLIDGSDYVVTDSFHGTAFAVLFKKNFYTVPHRTKGSRMVDLLKDLRLDGRIVSSFDSEMAIEDIDFTIPSIRLNELRKNSLAYIRASLDNTPTGQVTR